MIHAIESLTADATIEDAMERLLVIAKVEKGIPQADGGQTLSHVDIRERMARWLR